MIARSLSFDSHTDLPQSKMAAKHSAEVHEQIRSMWILLAHCIPNQIVVAVVFVFSILNNNVKLHQYNLYTVVEFGKPKKIGFTKLFLRRAPSASPCNMMEETWSWCQFKMFCLSDIILFRIIFPNVSSIICRPKHNWIEKAKHNGWRHARFLRRNTFLSQCEGNLRSILDVLSWQANSTNNNFSKFLIFVSVCIAEMNEPTNGYLVHFFP